MRAPALGSGLGPWARTNLSAAVAPVAPHLGAAGPCCERRHPLRSTRGVRAGVALDSERAGEIGTYRTYGMARGRAGGALRGLRGLPGSAYFVQRFGLTRPAAPCYRRTAVDIGTGVGYGRSGRSSTSSPGSCQNDRATAATCTPMYLCYYVRILESGGRADAVAGRNRETKGSRNWVRSGASRGASSEPARTSPDDSVYPISPYSPRGRRLRLGSSVASSSARVATGRGAVARKRH